MDFVTVEINKWGTYNPRKDFKNPRWFAMSNRLLEDPSIFELTAEEFKAFIYILCQASQKNSGTVQIFFKHAVKVSGLKKSAIISALKKLSNTKTVQVIENTKDVRETNASVHAEYSTLHNRTEQDTTEHNRTPPNRDSRSALISDEDLKSFLGTVGEEVISAWFDAYPKDWVISEIRKAKAWCLANKSRAPKSNVAKFLTNWFSRGWESYRKTISDEGSVDSLMALARSKGIEVGA